MERGLVFVGHGGPPDSSFQERFDRGLITAGGMIEEELSGNSFRIFPGSVSVMRRRKAPCGLVFSKAKVLW